MKRILLSGLCIGVLVIGVVALETIRAAEEPPFGGKADVEFAKALWEKMEAQGFISTVGAIQEGKSPHGDVVEILDGTIDGQTVIVKRGYGREGATVEAVKADREKFLTSFAVMVKREEGYDPDNANWFWVKYTPDGEIDTNSKGVAMAGRVAKGMDTGCIACHDRASSSDMVFMYAEDSGLESVTVE